MQLKTMCGEILHSSSKIGIACVLSAIRPGITFVPDVHPTLRLFLGQFDRRGRQC